MMKKIFNITALFTVIFMVSCAGNKTDGPVLNVSPRGEVSFTAVAVGESHTVNVSTNQSAWDAVSGEDWCTVTKSDNSFTLTALPNVETTSRTTAVTVSAGSAADVVITVTQAARTETDALSGYLTYGGETKPVIRSAFYYDENDGYKIFLSQLNLPGTGISDTPETMSIEMPVKFLGTEVDMDSEKSQRAGVFVIFYDKQFHNGNNGGNNSYVLPGKIKVSKSAGSNYFEVEITDLELNTGAVLSCRAAGVITSELVSDENLFIVGETDFAFGGIQFDVIGFALAKYRVNEPNYTDIAIFGYGPINEGFSLYFKIYHSASQATAGTYSFSADPVDKTFTGDSYLLYGTYEEGSAITGQKYIFTAGSFDLEISDYYFKLTLNDDLVTTQGDFPTATFNGDYTAAITRSGISHPVR